MWRCKRTRWIWFHEFDVYEYALVDTPLLLNHQVVKEILSYRWGMIGVSRIGYILENNEKLIEEGKGVLLVTVFK